jgi:hypothetical protein
MRVVGDANASGFRDPFKSSRDVNAIAEDVVLVENDVADMNADAEFDPEVLSHIRAVHSDAALDFNRAARRIDRTGKLDQHSVARSLDNATTMRGDCGVNERFSNRL